MEVYTKQKEEEFLSTQAQCYHHAWTLCWGCVFFNTGCVFWMYSVWPSHNAGKPNDIEEGETEDETSDGKKEEDGRISYCYLNKDVVEKKIGENGECTSTKM